MTTMLGLSSTDDENDTAIVRTLSWSMVGRSASIMGDPSSSSKARTSGCMAAYWVVAFWAL